MRQASPPLGGGYPFRPAATRAGQRPRGHPLDVAAGTERAARARQHDHSHVWIAARLFQSLGEIATHVIDKRVQALRPVQSDRDDP